MSKLRQLKKEIVYQHDRKDCGAACLLTAIKWYGYQASLDNLKALTGTSTEGATLLGLTQAANESGFKAKPYRANLESLEKTDHFCILHLTMENAYDHFVLCLGKENGVWVIADPEKGVITYEDNELDQVWQSRTLVSLEFNGTLDLQHKTSHQLIKWFWPLLKDHQNALVIIIVLGFFHAVFLFSTSVFTEKLVDELLPSKDRFLIFKGILTWASILLIAIGASYIRNYGIIRFSKDFNISLTQNFFRRLLFLPKHFFDSKKTGDLIARMDDTEGIEETATTWIEDGLIGVFIIAVSIGLLFIYDTQLALVNCMLLPLLFATVLSQRKRVIQAHRTSLIGHALNNANYIDTITGIETVKRHHLESSFSNQALDFYRSYREKAFSSDKIGLTFGTTIQLISFISTVLIISISSYKVLNSQLEIGNLLAIISIASIASSHTARLSLTYIEFEQAKVVFERMYELINQKREETHFQMEWPMKPISSLEISELSFSFPGQPPLLKGVSILLEQGKIATLLGESGSGKSTIINLISRLYKPDSGTISYNGENITTFSLDWRKRVGVVPQDIKVFNCSLLENIALNHVGKSTKETLLKVEQLVDSHGLIFLPDSLPFGFKTILGEGGVQLSGGQKQLLGLIRSLFSSPSILLLDEVTNSLDRKNEEFVMNFLQSLKAEIPILMITHSPITAAKTDYIYILENGLVSTQGTQEELRSFSNFYSEFFRTSHLS